MKAYPWSHVITRGLALVMLLVAVAAPGPVLLAAPAATPPTARLLDPGGPNGPEVTAAIAHDVSPALRDMRSGGEEAPGPKHEKPLRKLPNRGNALRQPDGALQTTTGPLVGTTNGLNIAGVGQGDYGFSDRYAPPDTNGAVGLTQYVQWVNVNFAVFDKATGALAPGFPKLGNSIWSGFGGGCQANNDGDPIVQYDKLANRWILTQFSVTSPNTYHYLQCVAVSTTSDATGSYYRYAFDYGTTQFNDYPKLAVWPDAYYISYNIFNNGSTFAGPKICALDRNAMLNGTAATQQCFQLSTGYGGLLPSDLDGTNPPPAGSPAFFLDYGSNALFLWKFHVDWANTANTTLTGPAAIAVASFSPACSGGGACIPQPGTTQTLDSLADRLMYRLAYRNRGGVESLVVNQAIATTSGGASTVGERWYELRNPAGSTMAAGTPVVYQQGTFAPDATYRWMGSIAMDRDGNIALGYSASSSSVYPSVRFTGRAATDALGTMQTENSIIAGAGSQLPTLGRWGDYSAMTVDPVDDCTFWYTNEYLKSSGTFNWSTRIASFKFPSCGSSSPTPPTVTQQPANQAVCQGAQASFTSTASGNPAPTVQWQVSTDNGATWTNITGATSTTYSFTAAAGDTGKRYHAVFTNSAGTATSNAATLTVNTAPVVTQQPGSTTVAAGSTATFTAAASGSPTPSVQWQVSGDGGGTWSNISGATSTTYSFAAQGTDSNKQYRAQFGNSCGSIATNAATLTVTGGTGYNWGGFQSPISNPPTLNQARSGKSVAAPFNLNGNFGLSVLASGSPTSQQVDCLSLVSQGAVSTTNGSLSYSATTGYYTYNWTTLRSWRNTCRVFNLTLNDGISHPAYFQFN